MDSRIPIPSNELVDHHHPKIGRRMDEFWSTVFPSKLLRYTTWSQIIIFHSHSELGKSDSYYDVTISLSTICPFLPSFFMKKIRGTQSTFLVSFRYFAGKIPQHVPSSFIQKSHVCQNSGLKTRFHFQHQWHTQQVCHWLQFLIQWRSLNSNVQWKWK